MPDHDYAKQAKDLTDEDLIDALSWQRALREHADENFQFREYEWADAKVKAIEAELSNRDIGVRRA